MAALQAGFGKMKLLPRIGSFMLGYGDFQCTTQHDDLFARAMVLKQDGTITCLLSLDLCLLLEPAVAGIRAAVAAQTGIPTSNIFVCTTHTHSAADGNRPDSFATPLAESCVSAVRAAAAQLQPARLASGYGQMIGHSINRRWMHRPVDPAVTVLRVDDLAGRVLGTVTNFGCHAIVLGMNNRSLSGDYPGFAMSRLEADLGGGAVCLFTQGGAGDVNPLDDRVRDELRSGQPMRANGGVNAVYYGPGSEDAPHLGLNWSEGDAAAFARVAALGAALADECLRVCRGLSPQAPTGELRVRHTPFKASIAAGEQYVPGTPVTDAFKKSRKTRLGCNPDENRTLDLMSISADGGRFTLLGIPGEVFSETAIALRRQYEQRGVRCPFIVSYANGFNMYFATADAFIEGGYEAETAADLLHSPNLTQRMLAAVAESL